MRFVDLAAVSERVAATSKRSEKKALFAELLRVASELVGRR
jgi:hypothetical protein